MPPSLPDVSKNSKKSKERENYIAIEKQPRKVKITRGESKKEKSWISVYAKFVERRNRFCNAVVEKVFTGTVCSRSEKKNSHAMQGLDLVIQKSRSE